MDPPEAVVIDVGLAELFPPSEAESFKSADAAGTLATMAPEVIRGSFNATRFTGGLALSPAFAGFGAGFWDGFRAGFDGFWIGFHCFFGGFLLLSERRGLISEAKCDVWSLGCCLYALLCTRPRRLKDSVEETTAEARSASKTHRKTARTTARKACETGGKPGPRGGENMVKAV